MRFFPEAEPIEAGCVRLTSSDVQVFQQQPGLLPIPMLVPAKHGECLLVRRVHSICVTYCTQAPYVSHDTSQAVRALEEAPDGYRFLDWSGQGLEVSDAAAVNFVVGVVLCR